MKKRSKIVVGASIACLFIAAIAIQAVFGGGMKIDPKEIEVAQGSTITYVITVYNYQDIPDSFDVFVQSGSCDRSWFSWTTNQISSVPANGGQKQVWLDVVNPTRNCEFTVRAVSKSNPRTTYAIQEANISVAISEPEPTPPKRPDLIITNIWHVGKEIHYEIKNIGNAIAPAGSETTLFVDDVSVKEDPVSTPLAPGESVEGYFENYDWITHCTQPRDKIKVCADNNDDIDELDESNNCREKTWSCNRPPTCIGLMPNLSVSQTIMTLNGTKEIKWTAFACDPDEDTLYYRFCLNGSGTGYTELIVQNWNVSNEWIWNAGLSDIGYSTIYADVRDGYHSTDSTIPAYDDSCIYENYTIMLNQPPCCACLMPDKSEPQLNGTQINWSACAIDPEGDQDQLWYRFWVKKGSGTWNMIRDWDTSNTWTWIPNEPGNYTIEVEIRDRYLPILSYPEHRDVYAQYKNYTITP